MSMTMTTQNALVGTFEQHTDAESAVKALQTAGYDMKKLSIVGKDFHTEEHVVGSFSAIGAALFSIGIPEDSGLQMVYHLMYRNSFRPSMTYRLS